MTLDEGVESRLRLHESIRTHPDIPHRVAGQGHIVLRAKIKQIDHDAFLGKGVTVKQEFDAERAIVHRLQLRLANMETPDVTGQECAPRRPEVGYVRFRQAGVVEGILPIVSADIPQIGRARVEESPKTVPDGRDDNHPVDRAGDHMRLIVHIFQAGLPA